MNVHKRRSNGIIGMDILGAMIATIRSDDAYLFDITFSIKTKIAHPPYSLVPKIVFLFAFNRHVIHELQLPSGK